MNLFSKILSTFGLGGLTNNDTGDQHSGTSLHQTEAGIYVSDERAMQVSAVWSCARLITETVGSLPMGIFERKADGRDPVERDHYVCQLFKRSPNQFMSPQEFREAMTLQLVLWGNAYGLIEWIGQRPVSIIPLKPERMTVVRNSTGLFYRYDTDKGSIIYSQQSIFHLKGFSPDGIVGLSPLAYARHIMGVSVSADKYASKQFSSGGQPKGVLKVDKFLTDEQRKQLRNVYDNISDSDSGSARTWVLEGGMDYAAISIPPDDMQMIQSREFQLGEIARIFRVPSHLINDSSKATSWGSGIEQLNIGFLTYTLRPYLTRWESAISDQLIRPQERNRIYAEHNVDGLLRTDSTSRAAFYSTMSQNGIMTRNEIRMRENLSKKDGADDLTVQVNLTPVEQLEKINASKNT